MYAIETKAQSSQRMISEDRKKHVKFGQMCRFCSLFSSIAMAWCHKVVRSKRNTTLKLCADCVEQFSENAQNCGKTNHGFCTMITYQLTHRCLCVSLCQKQNRNHASTTVFSELGSRWPFPFPKIEDTDETKAFCCDWGDKRKIETEAVGYIKKRVSAGFPGLEKTLT